MGNKIMVDPTKLDSASTKINGQADEYEKMYGQLFSEVDGLGGVWKGADNQAFVTQIKGFDDDFKKMVSLMRQYSEFLKNSATTYKNTQTEIINSAKRLTN